MARLLLLVACLQLALGGGGRALAAPAEKDCAALGFAPQLTLCSDCDTLSATVHDEALTEECRACCHAGEDEEPDVRYASAVLEADVWSLQAFPETQAFITNRAPAMPRLTVRQPNYRSTPTLILKAPGGLTTGPLKRVSVSGWKQEALQTYLDAKLMPGAPEVAAGKGKAAPKKAASADDDDEHDEL